MVKKTNNFSVKDFDEDKIVIEEIRKQRSPLVKFFIKNGKLIFATSFLFSITVFIIAFYLIMVNMEKSSIVVYKSNGVLVTFDTTDNSILDGTPITDSYANKVFDSVAETPLIARSSTTAKIATRYGSVFMQTSIACLAPETKQS